MFENSPPPAHAALAIAPHPSPHTPTPSGPTGPKTPNPNGPTNPKTQAQGSCKAKALQSEGLVAPAHKLIRILYGMTQSQTPYDEAEAFHITPQYLARRRRNLEKQAAAMGFQLVEAA